MLFNSIEFLIFLPVVFCLYWFVFNKHLKLQNLLILISSYIFYGWWDWRFLSLIFLSTVVDYFVGIQIFNNKNTKKKKSFLWLSIVFNLGLLGFFKYFNFFIESWIDLLSSVGYEYQNVWSLNIILPVGISFYTFQTMSYSLDIYYNKLKPTKDFISFASFVSFFPQLVAGPIERASNLLPQILKNRKFNYNQGVEGLRLLLWGMFKKVVIADNLALSVNPIFENYYDFNGGVLLLGLIYFSFQIYCDFSGYSDIAIGTSKLFGFELMSNFKFPYFSRNIGEFWKRWHISLSSWFRDYLYIPLGGSQNGKWISLRNIFIIFIVSGFWHGANLTFIAWGLIHALLYIPLFINDNNRKYISNTVSENSIIPSIKEIYQMLSTFIFVMITWVFFRSNSINDAFQYLYLMIINLNMPDKYRFAILFVLVIIISDWIYKKRMNGPINNLNQKKNWILCYFLGLILLLFTEKNSNSFIYFQF